MKKTRLAAFTLLECLVALLVIAGSLLVYQGLTKVLVHHTTYLSAQDQDHWLLFCQQFRAELSGARLVGLSNGRLQVMKKGQGISFGKFRSDDFRKTNADGRGYQPMLFGVESAEFSQKGQLIYLKVTFESGLERTFAYAFEEAS